MKELIDRFDEKYNLPLDYGTWIYIFIFLLIPFIIFIFQLIIKIVDLLKYYFSFYALIDNVILIPLGIQIIMKGSTLKYAMSNPLRPLRAFRIGRTFRLLDRSKTVVQKNINRLLLSMISLLFCGGGILIYLEQSKQTLSFHKALYFIVITIATVGYGDVVPQTPAGKVLIIILVVSTAFLIPYHLTKLNAIFKTYRGLSGKYTNNESIEHVILTGSLTTSSVIDFLREFITRSNPEKGYSKNIRIIALSETKISDEIKYILGDPFFDNWIKIVEGSPAVKNDLNRVSLKQAKACIILANKNTHNEYLEDSSNAMATLAVKDFCPYMRTYVQFILPDRKQNFKQFGVEGSISTKIMKMDLISLNCMYPGTSTFLSNLVQTHHPISTKDDDSMPIWEKEYLHGLSMEIYTVVLPKVFKNKTFDEVSLLLYQKLSIILFAIVIDDISGNPVCLLNPGNTHFISTGDIGYVIADSPETAMKVSMFHYKKNTNFDDRYNNDNLQILNNFSFKQLQENYVEDSTDSIDGSTSEKISENSKNEFGQNHNFSSEEKDKGEEAESEEEGVGEEEEGIEKLLETKKSRKSLKSNKPNSKKKILNSSDQEEEGGGEEGGGKGGKVGQEDEDKQNDNKKKLERKKSSRFGLIAKKKTLTKQQNLKNFINYSNRIRLLGSQKSQLFDRQKNFLSFKPESGHLGKTPYSNNFGLLQSLNRINTHFSNRSNNGPNINIQELQRNNTLQDKNIRKHFSQYKSKNKRVTFLSQEKIHSQTFEKSSENLINSNKNDDQSLLHLSSGVNVKLQKKSSSVIKTFPKNQTKKVDVEGYRRIDTMSTIFVGESDDDSGSDDSKDNINYKAKNNDLQNDKNGDYDQEKEEEEEEQEEENLEKSIMHKRYGSKLGSNLNINKDKNKEQISNSINKQKRGNQEENLSDNNSIFSKEEIKYEKFHEFIIKNCTELQGHILFLGSSSDFKYFLNSIREQEIFEYLEKINNLKQRKIKSIHLGLDLTENQTLLEESSDDDLLLNLDSPESFEPFEPISIVYICNKLPNKRQFEEISSSNLGLTNVFFCRCTPFDISAWDTLNLGKAKSVIILPNFQKFKEIELEDKHEYVIDSDTICLARMILSLEHRANLTLELCHPSNISFFELNPIEKENDNNVDHVHDQDQDQDQDHDNKKNKKSVKRKNNFNQRLKISKYFPNYFYNQVFASGKIFIEGFFDSLLAHSYFNPDILQIIKKLTRFSQLNISENIQQSRFLSIPLPKSMIGKNFKNLFYFLLEKKNILAIGLLRAKKYNRLQNLLPYVLINPEPQTTLFQNDQVYILGGNNK
ncbi:calcium-activated potassium channel alpha chain [Anaeramoeba flamelloides]|uniref:Calcium-activated potassium channel alpha chain n=1 Tax=Anaeramoeba flamelloides TaxID=1746091 RepID=A0AAV7ZV18_9EUKA|nr:calcium-activated potassium channel alpha chain [Anaeramoeba flamelloides]